MRRIINKIFNDAIVQYAYDCYKKLFMYFFKVHGLNLNDDLRLKIGLFNGLLHLTKPSLVSYIRGSTPLIIKTWDGYKFQIRPGTIDLSLASLIPEYYVLIKWFIPNAKGIVIDIGACIGGYTVRANYIADLVVAIEPNKNNFGILQKNVDMNVNSEKVILINKGISDKKGSANLILPKNIKHNVGAFSMIHNIKSDSIIEKIQVDTLDNIIAYLSLEKINLIKIDIEGALVFALKGMINTLKITDKIIVEIFEENKWLIDEIRNLDFKLIDIKDNNYFFIKNHNLNN